MNRNDSVNIKMQYKEYDKYRLGEVKKLPISKIRSAIIDIYSNAINNSHIPLLERNNHDRFVSPSPLRQRDIIFYDNIINSLLGENVHDIELSPVSVLGLNTKLGNIDIKNILTTSRGNEVVADATMALAIEGAKLRKKHKTNEAFRLATHHRMVRGQQFKQKGFNSHFRAFHFCIAGPQKGRMDFEINSLKETITLYLSIFDTLKNHGFTFDDIEVNISNLLISKKILTHNNIDIEKLNRYQIEEKMRDYPYLNLPIPFNDIDAMSQKLGTMGLDIPLNGIKRINKEVVIPLSEVFPSIKFKCDLSRVKGIGYYDGMCFHISAKNQEGLRTILADGGNADWTKKMLCNEKERFFASGLGTEFIYQYHSSLGKQ